MRSIVLVTLLALAACASTGPDSPVAWRPASPDAGAVAGDAADEPGGISFSLPPERWVTLLLEVGHEQATACRRAIAPFAELVKSPEHVHTYRLTPLSIWNDQQDSMAVRDAGWIQLYCADNQEAVDTTIQAYRIAEATELDMSLAEDGTVREYQARVEVSLRTTDRGDRR